MHITRARESHIEFATELTRLTLAWHAPEVSHPDVPALDVLAVVLGTGRSSRLYKRLREEAGLVHSIDAWCYAPGQAGLFGVDAVLDPGHRERVTSEILASLEEIRTGGIAASELQKARKLSLSHQLNAVTTMRGKAGDLGANWLLARNLNLSRDYLAAIQRVTDADIRRVAATYCTDANPTITSLNPEGTLTRRATQVATSAAGAIQKFELPNGLRLLVREDARLPLVSLVASFKAGLLAETAADNGITRLLSRVLMKGTVRRTAEQLLRMRSKPSAAAFRATRKQLDQSLRQSCSPTCASGSARVADTMLHASLPESHRTRGRKSNSPASRQRMRSRP